MVIHSSEFIKSCTSYKDKPKNGLPEFAFIGRSNVGKSSLINMLINRKNLARTSTKPGKTQTMHYFLINNQWFLVDLPGYGFAHVSHNIRRKWEKMIYDYVLNDQQVYCVFILIDSRLLLQQSDVDFMMLLGQKGVPFVVISTKSDKASVKELKKHLQNLNDFFKQYWDPKPIHIISSAKQKKGRNEILSVIENALK